ncbi:MAG: flagellar export protein FliJ [Thermoleophilia bacterium]
MSSRPFQFRLERVKTLRERAEQQRAEELAASVALRREGEEQLAAAADRVAHARHERRGVARATGADLLSMQAYIERTQRAEQAAALDLGRRDADVDARRLALVHAAREHRALTRLEERRRAEHAREVARIEGAQMDEVALTQHRRSAGL